jgi:hypothetical protein
VPKASGGGAIRAAVEQGGRLGTARWSGVGRRGGPGPIYRRLKAVRGGDFSGKDGSGELERLLETAPGDKTARAAAGLLVQVRGRLGVRVQWWSGACGGGAAGRWHAGGVGRWVAGGDDTGVMIGAGEVMAMCQGEVTSRGQGGVLGR